jgi:hypothetical protein
MLHLLFLLLVAHALVDFPLQNQFMAIGKSPAAGAYLGVPWYILLAAHAVLHGGAVYAVLLVTGAPSHLVLLLALTEIVLHGAIDYAKSLGAFGIVVDQLAHVHCKLLYVLVLYG